MSDTYKLLIGLLSAAVRGRRLEWNIPENTDWSALLHAARQHQVEPLLYYALTGEGMGNSLPAQEKAEWERNVLVSGIAQLRNVMQVRNILKRFVERGIPVILLKGLVIRELYPQPELRTMSDVDFLVHREDVEGAREILLQLGYREEDTTSVHIRFGHSSQLAVELHWTFSDERYRMDLTSLDVWVWENAVGVTAYGMTCRSLTREGQILYSCLHMAMHTLYNGFGLRLLCDLVLLVEKEGEPPDWTGLYARMEYYGLGRFAAVLFDICGRLFGMPVPQPFRMAIPGSGRYAGRLIKEIVNGGVYGKRSKAHLYGLGLLDYVPGGEAGQGSIRFRTLLRLIFPPAGALGAKFAFLRKYPFLLPVAWIGHTLRGILNKQLSTGEKLSIVLTTLRLGKKRAKLLQWLGLW